MNTVVTDFPECELAAFVPIFEPDLGQERFYVEDPSSQLRRGAFDPIPIVIGRTTDEFVDVVPGFLKIFQHSYFHLTLVNYHFQVF